MTTTRKNRNASPDVVAARAARALKQGNGVGNAPRLSYWTADWARELEAKCRPAWRG